MKKSIILLACVLGAFSAKAQTVIESTKFTDNWSVGINAGAVTPLTHSAFFKSMRPAFGVGFSKQLTPNFGLGFQGMGYVNTTQSKTAFDASDVVCGISGYCETVCVNLWKSECEGCIQWRVWGGYIIMRVATVTKTHGLPVSE